MFNYLFSFDSGILTYVSFLITNIAIYAMLGLGLNLQWGFTGLINFGVAGFVAVGAYGTVVSSLNGFPLPIAMMVGGLLAAIFGLGLGIATLRLREDYLAIVTIGAAELVRLIINNESLVDGKSGAIGINGFPLPLANFRPDIFTRYGMVLLLTGVFGLALWKLGHWYRRQFRGQAAAVQESSNKVWITAVSVLGALVILRADVVVTIAMLNFKDNQVVNGLLFCSVLMAALVFLLVETLVRSPWGRVLKAIREDEEVAKALGKNVFSYKLQSLMIGGFITGIGGAFYAWQQSNVYPDNFKSDLTFNVWILMVLGGAGSNPGVAIGAAIFWIYTTLTRDLSNLFPMVPTSQIDAFRMIFIGLLLIGLMVWRPQGLLGNRDELTLGK
jgi:neutral amino acid transport system permease protein